MRVKDENEAIKMSNDTTYGLSASIFSRNKKRARKIAQQIQAGSVCINDVMANMLFPSLPFGGMKNSGIGREYGIEGIRSFSQIQAVCEDRLNMRKELWWYPMNKKVQKLFRRFVKIYY
ncbi:aldehyde dehydrogenase family protein [Candidatus Neomarinimicrobiota bacterium]